MFVTPLIVRKIINSNKNHSIFVKDLQYCHYRQPYGSNLAITTMVTLLFMPSEECLAQNEYSTNMILHTQTRQNYCLYLYCACTAPTHPVLVKSACLAPNEYFGMKPQTLSYTHKLDRPTLIVCTCNLLVLLLPTLFSSLAPTGSP